VAIKLNGSALGLHFESLSMNGQQVCAYHGLMNLMPLSLLLLFKPPTCFVLC